MNNQSSLTRTFITIAVLIIAVITVYFSLNKKINISPSVVNEIGTSTSALPNESISTSSKPVITKLDLPQVLNVDQKGTWVIYASSTDGGELTYSVTWGDEISSNDPIITKNFTFTHSYSYPGAYNPVFTIYGSNGESVYASVGARVIGETTKAPIIYSLSPSSATVGTLIAINGAGFTLPKSVPNGAGAVPSNEVLFDNVSLDSVTMNGVNNLYFLIPDTAKEGKHLIVVKNQNGRSNSVMLEVTK